MRDKLLNSLSQNSLQIRRAGTVYYKVSSLVNDAFGRKERQALLFIMAC